MAVELQAILACVSSAVVYSLMFYAKKRARDPSTEFEPIKLASTLIVGAIIGVFYGYYGIPIEQPTISQQLATYAGTIALVESVLKFIVRIVRSHMSK